MQCDLQQEKVIHNDFTKLIALNNICSILICRRQKGYKILLSFCKDLSLPWYSYINFNFIYSIWQLKRKLKKLWRKQQRKLLRRKD